MFSTIPLNITCAAALNTIWAITQYVFFCHQLNKTKKKYVTSPLTFSMLGTDNAQWSSESEI